MAGVPTEPSTFFSLSPAERAKAFAFGIRRGELTKQRFDVNYWRLDSLVRASLLTARYACEHFGKAVTRVQYGCSKLATATPGGTPIVRMNNLKPYGWDFSDLKWVHLTDAERDTYLLKADDILFNRTNSKELVGKSEVFRELGDWVFASYLIRVRTQQDTLLPQFAVDFLNAPLGRLQIDQVSRQIIGMTNINAEELKLIKIPLPPIEIQARLVAALDKARSRRAQMFAEAESLVRGTDDVVFSALNLNAPASISSTVFAVSGLTDGYGRRLNPEYFHPERTQAVRELLEARSHMLIEELKALVDFIRVQLRVSNSNYVGLANVESHTGELLITDDVVSGACLEFKDGDVLFGRLRPYLNKVHLTKASGCCSPEFYVLRVKSSEMLRPAFLETILRSGYTLAQTRHMMTGNTHPRLTNEDVERLAIPVPPLDVQDSIVSELSQRKERSMQLRAEGNKLLDFARREFQAELVGDIA